MTYTNNKTQSTTMKYLGPFGEAKNEPWARSAPRWTVYSRDSQLRVDLPGVVSEIGQLVEELRYPPTLRVYEDYEDYEEVYEEVYEDHHEEHYDDHDDDHDEDYDEDYEEDYEAEPRIELLGPEYDEDGEAIEEGEGDAEEELGLSQAEIELLLAHSDLIRKTGEKIEDLPEDLSKLVEKARKMPIEKIVAEKIPEATASRVRAVFKKVSRKECRKMEAAPGSSDTEELHARRKLAASVRDRAIRATNAFRNTMHQETEHCHTSPCDGSYRHGRWFRSRCNTPRCSKAHSKDQLRRGILGRLCKYDGGKGLCSKPGCSYRHSKLGPGGCTCGLYDLLAAVRNCKRKRTVIETSARILCECPRVPESLLEKRPFSNYVRRALAAAETDERHRHRQGGRREMRGNEQQRGRREQWRRPAQREAEAGRRKTAAVESKPDKDGWSTVSRKGRRRR